MGFAESPIIQIERTRHSVINWVTRSRYLCSIVLITNQSLGQSDSEANPVAAGALLFRFMRQSGPDCVQGRTRIAPVPLFSRNGGCRYRRGVGSRDWTPNGGLPMYRTRCRSVREVGPLESGQGNHRGTSCLLSCLHYVACNGAQ